MELERRYVTAATLEVRRSNGKTRLEGYAVRYESLSEDMGFRERIERGAFSKHLRSDPDVRALVEHDPARIVGRTTSGTLQLIEDDSGVKASIDPPESQIGNDLVESVRRGDLSGMSFGFRALNDSWGIVDGESVRTIHEAELFDVSITAFPSYPDTTVAVRSLDRWRKESQSMSEVTTQLETPKSGRRSLLHRSRRHRKHPR